jgi:transposase InsO family protein
MGLRVKSMAELRLDVLLEAAQGAQTVSEVCRRHGISRKTYYHYLARYRAEGLDGLEPRSSRPVRQPARMDPGFGLDICGLRTDNRRFGPRRIPAEFGRRGIDPPAVSSMHQALVRNLLVVPQRKRERPADRRFEWPAPNDLWQIDATRFVLEGGRVVWVMDLLDDHARFCLAARVGSAPTTLAAVEALNWAISRYGVPARVLSDNGSCFTGRLWGNAKVLFEKRLEELGITAVHSRPYHPQTLGKLERFHRTMKEWISDYAPTSAEELQDVIERFRVHYNTERPHQALGDCTPVERYTSAPAPAPDVQGLPMAEPTYPPGSLLRKVSSIGIISVDGNRISLGRRWALKQVRVIEVAGMTHIYFGDHLVRSLVINPDTIYQTAGTRQYSKESIERRQSRI